jgi:hypothetical protein
MHFMLLYVHLCNISKSAKEHKLFCQNWTAKKKKRVNTRSIEKNMDIEFIAHDAFLEWPSSGRYVHSQMSEINELFFISFVVFLTEVKVNDYVDW